MNRKEAGYTQHISAQYNRELDALKNHLMAMGGLVEKHVAQAVGALVRGDTGVAQRILDDDSSVDAMEVSIDEQCARILARRQPAASDLRLVIAIGKLNTDLERIGDEAAKIARQAIQLSASGGRGAPGVAEVHRLGERVCEMLRVALDALARLDAEPALAVVREEEVADLEYGAALRGMVAQMHQEPGQIDRLLNVIWALRALERVGDHARNIAEYVIYLVVGRDVRHLEASEVAAQLQGD